MPTQSAYDFDNRHLVAELMRATARAVLSSGQLDFNPTEPGGFAMEMLYLHGVVESRLNGHSRHFIEEDVVVLTNPESLVFSKCRRSSGPHSLQGPRGATIPSRFVVTRVQYEYDGTWSLYFEGHDDDHYPADRFEKVRAAGDVVEETSRRLAKSSTTSNEALVGQGF